MISRAIFAALSVFVCLSACADQEPSEEQEPVELSFTQKEDWLLTVSAKLSPDVTLDNIRIRNDKHLNDWVLELKSASNLRISSTDSTFTEGVVQLDDSNYSRLIQAILDGLQVEYPQFVVSRIQIDIGLVDRTWQSVLSTVRRESQNLAGNVEQKDLRITNAVVETIANSQQVRRTCDALEAYGVSCRQTSVTMNPVAFRPDVVGMPWASLDTLADPGLRRDAWFTIRTK